MRVGEWIIRGCSRKLLLFALFILNCWKFTNTNGYDAFQTRNRHFNTISIVPERTVDLKRGKKEMVMTCLRFLTHRRERKSLAWHYYYHIIIVPSDNKLKTAFPRFQEIYSKRNASPIFHSEIIFTIFILEWYVLIGNRRLLSYYSKRNGELPSPMEGWLSS